MEYPKNWEREVSAWVDDEGNYGDVVITRSEEGPAAHKVKGRIDWLATLHANWKSVAAAVAVAAALVGGIVLIVRICRKK